MIEIFLITIIMTFISGIYFGPYIKKIGIKVIEWGEWK